MSTARDVLLLRSTCNRQAAWTVERRAAMTAGVRQSNESNRKFGCKKGENNVMREKSKGEKRGTWRDAERPRDETDATTRPADRYDTANQETC